jgi:hypothetical protein
MQLLKDKYSEMLGIGFYGSPPGSHTNGSNPIDVHDTATLELIEFANKSSVEMWLDSPAALKSDDADGSIPGCIADLAAACGSFHADKTFGALFHAVKTLCDHRWRSTAQVKRVHRPRLWRPCGAATLVLSNRLAGLLCCAWVKCECE